MLLGITVITYAIITLAPGDPITALINPEEMNVLSPEEIEAMREDLGLNEPLPVRYVLWLREARRGQSRLSRSRTGARCRSDPRPAAGDSLALSVTSIVIADDRRRSARGRLGADASTACSTTS